MKNRYLKFSFIFLMIVCLLFVCGCEMGKRDERKINRRVEKGNPYTYVEIIEKYGQPTEHRTLQGEYIYSSIPNNFTGYACYYIGFNSEEEYFNAAQNGATAKSLLIEFKKGLAVKATYQRVN